jgi:pentatricopeptide repeat protein
MSLMIARLHRNINQTCRLRIWKQNAITTTMKAFSIWTSDIPSETTTEKSTEEEEFSECDEIRSKSKHYENKRTCRQLIDQPVGCYWIGEYVIVKDLLDQFKLNNGNSKSIVNLSIKLLARVVRELSTVQKKSHHFLVRSREWALNPSYVNVTLLRNWKTAHTKGLNVIPPMALWDKLDIMAKEWMPGEFRYDVDTVILILEAMIYHKSPTDAPAAAEEVLQRLSTSRDSFVVKPNAALYNVVLSCWAKSGLPEASDRIDAIVDRMRKEQQIDPTAMTAPNAITYNILLRYWGGKPDVEKMEAVYKMMIEKDNISPNLRNLLPVVSGYCKARLLVRARNAIHEMISIQKRRRKNFLDFDGKDEDENRGNRLIAKAANKIMLACQSIVMSDDNLQKGQTIALAEEIWDWIEKQTRILVDGIDGDMKSGIKLATTLMDIHSRCGYVHRANELAIRIDELSNVDGINEKQECDPFVHPSQDIW